MTISITSIRVKEIENYIKNRTDAETNMKYDSLLWTFRGQKLKEVYNIIGGKKYSCDTIFRMNIDLLHYNFQNRRIAIYLKEREIEKKTTPTSFKSSTVSEENLEDQQWMQDLLLGKRTLYGIQSNTPGFREELIAKGQIEPAVITVDGTLRNGNRRKAIFHDILDRIKNDKAYAKLKPEEFKYLKVIVLPRDITDAEIFDLENFLQTKREWKQDYDSLSVLNIIKEAKDKYGIDFREIKQRYLHDRKETDIEDDYNKIKKIDQYLEFKGKLGQYGEIHSQKEMFADNVNYDFENVGLASIPREKKQLRDAIVRKRRELFFDMVNANSCNSEILKPSEKATRDIVQEIFKIHTSDPGREIDEIEDFAEKARLVDV